MAKNQSRKPGRDVRGGKGGSSRPGAASRGNQQRGGQRPYGQRDMVRGRGGAGAGERRGQGARRGASANGSLIEGRRAAAEALDTGLPIRRAFVQKAQNEADPTLERLVERLLELGIEPERLPKARLDEMSSHGAHQGIVLETRPFEYATVPDVIAAAGEGDALVVLLDHVTDEGNFGAIVRSAEVVGAAGVIIAKARAASVGVGAYKTSAGAVMHLPIAQVSNLATAIEELKGAGFWVCGATEHAEQSVWDAPLGGRLCIVMGSEGEGISRLVRERCDFECRLPQRGRVESLNVAQATTVLCYEWLRRQTLAEAAEAAVPEDAGYEAFDSGWAD